MQATVNESQTDKLIRELREENAKLMSMLKDGKIVTKVPHPHSPSQPTTSKH